MEHALPPLSSAATSADSLPAAPLQPPSLGFELVNGLQVQAQPEAATPLVCLEYHLGVGSLQDPPAQHGLASLSLTAVLKGSQQRPARALAEALEDLGAQLSVGCGWGNSSIRLEGLAQHLPQLLDWLAEVVCTPALSDSEIHKEKQLVLTGLEQAEESAHYLASEAFMAQIYAGNNAAVASEGTPQSVAALTPAHVRHFYQRFYLPSASRLVLAGALEPAALQAAVEKAFGPWLVNGQPPASQLDVTRQQQPFYQHLVVPEREQCVVLLGHLGVRRQHPDFAALLLLEVILGSGPGFASRIPGRIRDQLGLVYHISLSATAGASLYPGLIQAQAECAPEKLPACVQGIREEMHKVQQELVSPAELDAAKAYLMGQLLFQFETNAQRCRYLHQRAVYGWPQDFLQQWRAELLAVSQQDLQAAAQRHFQPDACTLITAGPTIKWTAADFEP